MRSSRISEESPEKRIRPATPVSLTIRSGFPEPTLARGIILILALLLTLSTWAHWGDIQTDCGRELYVPLEVLRGKLVYRDFWYPYGPLMPYVQAFLVASFGRHLAVFYLFGLAVTVLSALLVLELGRRLEDTAIGLIAASALILQAFEPWQFNFIFPYSYAATVGLLLGLLCIFLLLKYILNRNSFALAFAGVTASLALICKQEVGIACYVTLSLIIGIEALLSKSLRTSLTSALLCAPGIIISVVVYGWFFWELTPALILDNWLGPSGPYFAQKYGKELYAGMGMRFRPLEIVGLLISAALALRLWYWLGRMSGSPRGRCALAVVVAFPLIVRVFTPFAPWSHALLWHLTDVLYLIVAYPRGMYFIGCGFLAYIVYLICRNPVDRRLLAPLALGIFSVALAVRVFAQVVPFGYSIYYATPLFLVFLLAVSKTIKTATAEWECEQRNVTRAIVLILEMAIFAALVFPGKDWRTAKFETGWGVIYLSPADAGVAGRVLKFMSAQTQLGRRVVIVPEAPIMYALTGTEAPDRWYTLLPGFLSAQQEEDYIADLRRENPKYVVVTARNFEEYGAPHFGIDFDQEIYRWIEANYGVAGQFGRFRRDGSRGFAALLYERRGPERASGKPIDLSRDR